MDLTKLYEILAETTVQLRKGPEVTEHESKDLHVVEIFDMPHVSEATKGLVQVDVELLVIGVDPVKAAAHRDELIAILRDYPEPQELKDGPSYITVGARIGDQGAAFCLFALGQVLGLWKVITPRMLGVTGEVARRAAGNGYVLIGSYDVRGHDG